MKAPEDQQQHHDEHHCAFWRWAACSCAQWRHLLEQTVMSPVTRKDTVKNPESILHILYVISFPMPVTSHSPSWNSMSKGERNVELWKWPLVQAFPVSMFTTFCMHIGKCSVSEDVRSTLLIATLWGKGEYIFAPYLPQCQNFYL